MHVRKIMNASSTAQPLQDYEMHPLPGVLDYGVALVPFVAGMFDGDGHVGVKQEVLRDREENALLLVAEEQVRASG